MRIAQMYEYLVRQRRDLQQALAGAPDEALSRPMLQGADCQCIKDLVFHIAAVEDGWIREDILRLKPLLCGFPELSGPQSADVPIAVLLGYWKQVERFTVGYVETLTDIEVKEAVSPHDNPTVRYTVGGLLWHIMIHEMRHTAQIAMLLRMHGIQPPALDLLWHLDNKGRGLLAPAD